jgi:large subunit ribosomal protein L22
MNKSLTATLKYALVSDKKMSLMAKLIKGKKVEDALDTLNVLPKKAAKILLKVVKSAYSNAKNA